jgi:hypothetical protein
MTRNPNTQALAALGQSLWIDNITRTMLADGTLQRYISELSITGLTSNPTIFEKAMAEGDAYDAQIAALSRQGLDGEPLFFALAVQDLAQAADLFRSSASSSSASNCGQSLKAIASVIRVHCGRSGHGGARSWLGFDSVGQAVVGRTGCRGAPAIPLRVGICILRVRGPRGLGLIPNLMEARMSVLG